MQNGSLENGFIKDNNNNNSNHHHDARVENATSTTSHLNTKAQILNHSIQVNNESSNSDFPDGPAAKRRKLAEITTFQNPHTRPRPQSPPWKKFEVEGPSSFEEEGRRKSSRTNRVPLDLQPPANKRRTRAAVRRSPHPSQSKYGSASRYESRLAAQSSGQSPSKDKLLYSSAKAKANTYGKSPARGRQHKDTNTRQPAISQPLTKRPYKKRSLTFPQKPTTTQRASLSPLRTRRAVRQHGETATKRKGEGVALSEWHHSDASTGEDGSDEDDEDYGDSIEEAAVASHYRPQRLNLKVRLPSVKIHHPEQVLPPKRFPSFRDWVEQEGSRDETQRKIRGRITEEAILRQKITEAAKPGGLLSPEKCQVYAPESQEDPLKLYTHHDHLVAHAIYFRRLVDLEHNAHVQTAKILAYEAAGAWKLRQPKTREEYEQEQEAEARAIYKQVRKDLMQKWDIVAAEVERQRLQRWEEEQQLLDREALNKVIEQSTQLLDRRRRRSSSCAVSEESEGEETRNDDKGVKEGASLSNTDSPDEDNMSASSESNSEEHHASSLADDDEGLTQAELVEKYSKLPTSGSSRQSIADSGDLQNIDATFSKSDIADAVWSRRVHSNMDSLEQPQGASDVETFTNTMADDSDESTNMDEDMGDSDSNSFDDSGDTESKHSRSSEEGERGLLGFFDAQSLERTQITTKKAVFERGSSTDAIDDISLVPNTIQVLTPSASNSEEPLLKVPQELDMAKTTHGTFDHDNFEVDACSDPLRNLMSITSIDNDQQGSLPNTPVSTNPLKTAVPSLLRGTLREYQHFGLDWLAGLYANGTNGILADEMGLGKTIQTIALLAHLALEHEIWGPHLIVVPTSVMLNWEMEFKKFLPGFKVLTYYGTQEERKQKRQGWVTDSEKWNVWITSYQLALKDDQVFKRREWHYMVLDEAHNIKNFRSKRWQTLLTFNTKARLLLTGTPLQNNLTELWSLLFFLMPSDSTEAGIGGFADLQDFSSWFRKPVEHILEHGRENMDDDAKAIVAKLHKVLRPYLLRRLKADVEKQMPGKFEHVVYCRLSKRQRYLYDGFMSRAQTRETLASGNYLSIINCLMQLRKVCNHPDLFETRQIVTSFSMPRSAVADFEIKEFLIRRRLLRDDPMTKLSLNVVNLLPGVNEQPSALDTIQRQRLGALGKLRQLTSQQRHRIDQKLQFDGSSIESALSYLENSARRSRFEDLHQAAYLTSLRSQRRPLYSRALADRLSIIPKCWPHCEEPDKRTKLANSLLESSPALKDMVLSLPRRAASLDSEIQKFACVTPAVVASDIVPLTLCSTGIKVVQSAQNLCPNDPFHRARMPLSIAFPDKRLLQYDCGKLQRLDALLRTLQSGNHRALIFTQMTKVLDILEQFLNIHGHRYLRLDGSTKIEQRQILTERFNNDPRILVFILSSRSGGLGINLTGADSVIFYDLDWNPAMDKQCQDRCHRIGQTRDVHIYRFVSEYTIEANILRKANQKRMLDDVVIQEGEFTTDYFNNSGVRSMLQGETYSGDADADAAMDRVLGGRTTGQVFEHVEDQEDIAAARIAEREIAQQDAGDFDDKVVLGSGGGATPKISGPPAPEETIPLSRPPSRSDRTITLEAADSGLALQDPTRDQAIKEEEEEEGIGHIDTHFLRHVEWELQEVAAQPSKEKHKKPKKVVEHKGKIG
ncbi:MAG: hypothetical protein Q9190_004170 [Brigantiaea leucoxantha]